MIRTISLEKRFWAKVKLGDPDACWEWRGSIGSHGYGQINSKGKPVTAHRLSWEIHFGLASAGLQVLHKCDNRKCVNPAHLFLGTQKDNVQDMMNKGRCATLGVNARSAKLDPDRVQMIRDLLRSTNLSQREIARRFNVGYQAVQHIARGECWKWLKD